ncbi:isoaspartyl peptidase/L-asparaginase [Spirosoma taeanense]|uniref:Isoaspartyl peptidase n=1 Tax=Spirosoma taeanense TaxID=2735870 RepID=A0A6M5Y8T3_9BACT|nr:isoaspartyl peptidase/L-asparaginase [Spirosoma taeanense]QJW89603.1 isoaspartyl peptidase/L-asparaginase [Spirosoma taeanense]
MYVIAIHGGSGTINRSEITSEQEEAYRQALGDALDAGYTVLARGGSALDAVEQAVRSLEDNELFNAGKGAVFSANGKHEMDASIMCGRSLKAGAVAGVTNIRNPISLARTVMEHSDNVFLLGSGAEDFAREHKLAREPDAYFYTALRAQQLKEAQAANKTQLDHSARNTGKGTVGAVALDKDGNLASATSTGGLTNKKYGRVGDTPIIGAGTYASNQTCAVSCTGYGEFFIRAVVAYDIACLMEYKGLSLKAACDYVVQDKLKKMGGEGGLIAVDGAGNVELPFNSEGMYRAWRNAAGEGEVTIFA